MIFVRLARLEPGGAKGLLESMAAGNIQSYRPSMMERKCKVNIVLHRSNGWDGRDGGFGPRESRRGLLRLACGASAAVAEVLASRVSGEKMGPGGPPLVRTQGVIISTR
jgi:hypothetical protein